MVQVDTAALRAAAKRLRDEAADVLGQANAATHRTEERYAIGFAFDHYGSGEAYRAVSGAWRGELGNLAAALRQLAEAMDTAADNYDRSDAGATARLGGVR